MTGLGRREMVVEGPPICEGGLGGGAELCHEARRIIGEGVFFLSVRGDEKKRAERAATEFPKEEA